MLNPATPKQMRFIDSLASEREMRAEHRTSLDRAIARYIDKAEASRMIEWLLGLPPRTTSIVVPEGMHKLGASVYKVQLAVHGSGKPYAKKLVKDDDGSWSFVYAPSAVRRLSDKTLMTLEEAKEFGVLYGTCCVCGRTLTNEESINEGIGPVCGGRF